MSCTRLEIRGLTVALADRSRILVDDVSLVVPAGGSVAVVGESGAGKSMTTRAIFDLLPKGVVKTSGDVFIGDRRLGDMDRRCLRATRARDLGVVMQNPMSAFDPVFTVESHFADTIVASGRRLSRRDRRGLAVAAMREAGLADADAVLSAYPFQLSGGMLQRVMVAMALVNNPEFLIADEPTTDLDLVSQRRVLDLLRDRVRDRHLGLLLITHDLAVAAALAETAAIMRDGKIVETGAVRDILTAPVHPYTRELVQAHHNLYSTRFGAMLRAATGGTA
ncbi:MAG: ABC transporter ATP-binding protein [Planctomycetes bacterium]|nr:ABC transporter ATP-binding protein [Planctomycetota bacterium]